MTGIIATVMMVTIMTALMVEKPLFNMLMGPIAGRKGHGIGTRQMAIRWPIIAVVANATEGGGVPAGK